MFHRCIATGLLLAAVSLPVWSQAPLPEKTVELLRAANIPADELGAIAVRLADGAVVLAHGAERSLQPASTLKLLTTIVGLDRLGPTRRARTELMATAGIARGHLQGDLFLRGGGSPDVDWQALQRLLEQLRFQGVARIDGDVVLDREFFSPPRTDIGVPPFDETPEDPYNVIPDALLLNFNLLQVDLSADAGALRAQFTPALDRVTIAAGDVRVVDRPCEKWEDGWKLPTLEAHAGGRIRILLHGEFPAHCSATKRINVLERNVFADRLFRALWRSLGGTFGGRVRDGATPPGARVLAAHASRTLAEHVHDINKRSDNPMARLLYLTLGTLPDEAATAGTRATAERADKVVRAWLAEQGLSAEGLVLENGSGLSRRERIRPALLAGVLAAAARSNWAHEFAASMPILGVEGAPGRRMRTSPAASKGRLKPGGLRNVVGLAGYVPDASGRMHAVVVVINHEPWDEAGRNAGRPVLDSVIDWVARAGAQ